MNLAPSYGFVITGNLTGSKMLRISLYHKTDTTRVKVFNVVGDVDRLADHMESLTEDQCNDFTKPARQPKPKEKNKAG